MSQSRSQEFTVNQIIVGLVVYVTKIGNQRGLNFPIDWALSPIRPSTDSDMVIIRMWSRLGLQLYFGNKMYQSTNQIDIMDKINDITND